MQNQSTQEAALYQSPQKTHVSLKQLMLLSGSRQKDKILISRSLKKRQSRRTQVFARFTQLNIINGNIRSKDRDKQRHHQRPSQKQVINSYYIQQTLKLSSQSQSVCDQINAISQNCEIKQYYIARLRGIKETLREIYHNQQAIKEYSQNETQRAKQEQFQLRKMSNDLYFDSKQYLYQITSEVKEIEFQTLQIHDSIQAQQSGIRQNMEQLEQITENLIRTRTNNQNLLAQAQNAAEENDLISKRAEREQRQLFVLKLQLNISCYIGFNVNLSGQDPRLIFEKQYKSWDRSKQRKTTIKDMKRYIIFQLYKHWNKILRKLSYQSNQYSILFGEAKQCHESVIEGLKSIIVNDSTRVSSRRISKIILISTINQNYQKIKGEVYEFLSNFQTEILKINQVEYLQIESEKEEILKIKYILFDEQFAQVFRILYLPQLNKEQLTKLVRETDKRLFAFLEVPMLLPKNQMQRYEQIYQFIRKRQIRKI